jgi:hypothetical protein
MWYWKLEKTFISRHFLHQHWYICPIALPVRWNPKNRSILTVVWATSISPLQLLHQRKVCHPVVNRFTLQTLPKINMNHFFMDILCISPFVHINAQQNAAFRYYTPQALSPFWLQKPASEHGHARLLLSWSCTVLLPSDTHRKPITSITAVLLPFVTYSLTLPRNSLLRILPVIEVRFFSTKFVFLQSSVKMLW